jgi:hypothetical protein
LQDKTEKDKTPDVVRAVLDRANPVSTMRQNVTHGKDSHVHVSERATLKVVKTMMDQAAPGVAAFQDSLVRALCNRVIMACMLRVGVLLCSCTDAAPAC